MLLHPQTPLPNLASWGLWHNRASALLLLNLPPRPMEPGNIPLTLAIVMQVLSPTYKQRNEDFRKLFKQLPDSERLIVGEWGNMGVGVEGRSGSSGDGMQAASD